MKNMLSLPALSPTIDLYSKEILSFNQLTYYEAILFILKVTHGLVKCNVQLSNQFIISNKTTRNAFNLRTPNFTMSITQKSIFYRGLELYNNIPNNIKKIKVLSGFKLALKLYIFGKYPVKKINILLIDLLKYPSTLQLFI